MTVPLRLVDVLLCCSFTLALGPIDHSAQAACRRMSLSVETVPQAGKLPPAISALDLDGRRQELAQYAGRVVVLHFWASWCPYCRGEIPELRKLQTDWGAKGVQVLTVSVDENLDKLKQFVAEEALPYPVIPDVQLAISERYAIQGIPVTLILSRDGRVAFRALGSANLIEAVQRTLDAAPSSP